MASFELNLLGGFEIRKPNGDLVPLSSKKARALLAFLSQCPGQTATRSKIATLLWGDRSEEQARGSLRQTLSGLRKALSDPERDVLHLSSEGVRLDKDRVKIDTMAFQSFALEEGLASLQQAADLYKGPFFDGVDLDEALFEEWLRNERSRLAACAANVMMSLLKQCGDDASHDVVLSWTARLIQIDPLREDAYRAAMRLYQEDGRWNEALRQYEVCKAVLATELGIEPQEETEALYQEILAHRDRGHSELALPQIGRPSVSDASSTRSLLDDGRPSIAVMPFDNLGGDSDQSSFVDGVTEDIITELSRFPGLTVIARNSTFSYTDNTATPQEIGNELGVHYVVKGSTRKMNNRVRITAQLIETVSAKHVWAERYDRELTDIFALQDELTRGIVAVLPGRIEKNESGRVVRKLPEVMAAYELLLAGKIYHHRFAKDDCIKALDLINRAVALAPNYAAAYAWKACVLGQALGRGFLPDPKALYNGAVEAAGTALRLDENDVEAHRVHAEIAIEAAELSTAEHHNERALILNPNDPRLLAQKGEILTWLGQAEEGAGFIRTAMRLDPYSSPVWSHLLGRALMMSGTYGEASEAYLRSSFPRFGYHADAAGCYAKLAMSDKMNVQVGHALTMEPNFTISRYIAGLPYLDEAERARHREILSASSLPLGD